MLKKIALFTFLSLVVSMSWAQDKLLGQVINFEEEPVVNARVYLDGKATDSYTNQRGYFEVTIPENTRSITIVSEKYGQLTTPYNQAAKMNFVYLNYEVDGEDEEGDKVQIGYGSVDRENATHATQDLDFKNQDQTSGFMNVYDLIRARVPGVRVTDDNRIIIRGRSTINSSSRPLFVVNGTVVPSIDYILPSEVKDIEVLRDGSASIYGSRGANGVIIITLKD